MNAGSFLRQRIPRGYWKSRTLGYFLNESMAEQGTQFLGLRSSLSPNPLEDYRRWKCSRCYCEVWSSFVIRSAKIHCQWPLNHPIAQTPIWVLFNFICSLMPAPNQYTWKSVPHLALAIVIDNSLVYSIRKRKRKMSSEEDIDTTKLKLSFVILWHYIPTESLRQITVIA